MITPDNAPRDLGALTALSRAVRYRLALNTNIYQAGSDQEKAWVAMTPQQQAESLLGVLQDRDRNAGQSPAAPAVQPAPQPAAQPMMSQPTAPQPMTPQPMSPQPIAPQPIVATAPVAPQPVAAQPMTAPVVGAPMAPQPLTATAPQPAPQLAYQPAPQPTPMFQQPAPQPAPPPMAGAPAMAAAPQPMAPQPLTATAPTPAPAPVATQPSGRQPSTVSDPTNAGAAGGTPFAAGVNGLQQQLQAIKAELETCAGTGETEELKSLILGMSRTLNILGIVLLELAEGQLGMDKPTIIAMANAASKAGEPEKWFEGVQGKE